MKQAMELKVFTAFSGYDSQCLALDRCRINYDLVGWSEIEKYAIMAHNALFPQYANRNYGDISKIDWKTVPDFDLFTYSFPCQDLSKAGRLRGLDMGSGTRSSLLWECQRAIEEKMPKYLLMENVPNLVSKRFIGIFNEWTKYLQSIGYRSYSAVLNAKNYGIPQNRERVYCVSILDEADDVYYFPDELPLKKTFIDMVDDSADESYYLTKERIEKATFTITKEGNIRIPQATEKGYKEVRPGGVFDASYPSSTTRRGRVQDEGSVCPTICAHQSETLYYDGTRIRKLTERECYRLMGLTDTEIDKIKDAGVPKVWQYRTAGNSIVVDVLVAIFSHLLLDKTNDNQQLKLF